MFAKISIMKKLSTLVGLILTGISSVYAKDDSISLYAIEKGILGTILYSAIGMIMAIVAYRIIDIIIPGKISHQITEDKNLAVGVVVAAFMLGICIIIAAAIVS